MKNLKERALEYHKNGKPGKIEVIPTKLCSSADELSLAYTPGVAEPVLEIDKDKEKAYEYTAKGNLVGVVTNGTAILGLGNRGALASKPVMEGKAVLFKRFADIDCFDIELDTEDPQKIIDTVKLMEPTFGGINLEDIKSPECFIIEKTLIEQCNIPVFHDDQHGTAIITTAGLINASEVAGKKLSDLKVVVNGAGAAGISVAKMFVKAGVRIENLLLCDRNGVIFKDSEDNNSEERSLFAQDTDLRSLEEALVNADVFAGLSAAGALKPEYLEKMANNPIVFAMANPTPEIDYKLAKSTREDVIMATGRSDYPNQINNVLGFPFIFRGALDVRATKISEGMKMAAAKALASLAKEPVPKEVISAYGQSFSFGPNYIVPKPFDPRVIEWASVAVAKAACEEGLAKYPIKDWDLYKQELKERMKKHWK
ncbi:malate dehydrogenase [Thiospirochaeta perfilievii]|uniref:Malate dehydrogenase n=1 Tax=Thiospirochaeta perfilievii TaxID=252967 RepID=A0A5C1QHL2_9SPIO|nr:malic enzyme-like NAD(P)-binding protein [Thiospirochaeta perfilievii]QEN05742.1 malate dehydrogenase [Thiospirochaeta perfilievii]